MNEVIECIYYMNDAVFLSDDFQDWGIIYIYQYSPHYACDLTNKFKKCITKKPYVN